ncbi:MAG: cupin domain-containing protein [Emcibacteraceae bacterium]|nr:cupin domain-containing protein [Emcibacteraceae bacterium]MDG1859950.1 cupin domain-containing protein [Emcibacteraceae bacterium]
MNTKYITTAILSLSLGLTSLSYAQDADIPAKISKEDMTAKIFEHPGMITTHNGGGTQLDVQTFLSSDKKFDTGRFTAGAGRMDITEPYGVDEFMYFLEGSVKLTSSDGTVQVINAGEAVTVSKEWTGIWETEGYSKIYVIYYPEPVE